MELIFDIIADVVFNLIEKAIKGIKNEKIKLFAAAILAFAMTTLAVGFAVWGAISFYEKGNMLAAIVFVAIAVLILLLIGFIVLRRIIRRKNK